MENAKKFYEALTKDTAMQERLKEMDGYKSDDEAKKIALAIEFAKKEGYSLTADEVKAYAAETEKRELSDEQLDNVAGGIKVENQSDEFSVCPRCQSEKIEWKYNDWWFFKDWWTVCNNCGYDGKRRC